MSHITPSAIMPSSEMHFFDVSQSHLLGDKLAVNTGINTEFPHPSSFVEESGTLKTYASGLASVEKTGIFHYNKLQGEFSNAPSARENSITDFKIFNKYIFHYKVFPDPETGSVDLLSDEDSIGKGHAIKVPYVADMVPSVQYQSYQIVAVQGLDDILAIVSAIT